jgi:hypothetical protein
MVLVRDLTWEGYEFLAVLQNDHGWAKLKQAIPMGDLAKMPLKIIQELATGVLLQWAKQKIGLP